MRLLADSAAEVVLTVNPERLKTCAGNHCGWMFVDESPNNRRRWCAMAICGNRAKAKRHYEATKNSS
jgi:predicted RNA-binding Zn ribbon-like protein